MEYSDEYHRERAEEEAHDLRAQLHKQNEAEYYQQAAEAEYNELEYTRKLLKDALDAIEFNIEHSKPVEDRMQSDFFNINVNVSEEIKRYLKPVEQSQICNTDNLPF